jgi:hypothetical protein
VSDIATVTNRGGLRFPGFPGRCTAAVLPVFLARRPAGRPGRAYVVLDGHPPHRAKEGAAGVAGRADRIRPVVLPPYSPDLSPAERLNSDGKANAQRAGRARDRKSLAHKARGYLRATQRLAGLVRRYFRGKQVRYAAA